MRIAYVTIHVAPELMQGGVGKKIRTQIKIWNELGHNIRLFSLTPKIIPFPKDGQFIFNGSAKLIARELSRASSLKQMLNSINAFLPDVIYLRFGLYSFPLQRIFNIAPVVLETNSDDIREYRKRGQFFYWVNRLTRGMTFSGSKGIICPSYELADIHAKRWKKPFAVISNGVDMKQAEVLPPTNNDWPVVTMVCSPGMVWHGVDKLVKFAELAPDVIVNLVGYSKDDIRVSVPPNLHLWGFLEQDSIRDVLSRTDVAIGSLALHRNKMEEASVLKIREALSYGIPVVIAFKDTDLHNLDIDTILHISNTEDNVAINFQRIRRFAFDMIGKRVDLSVVGPHLDQFKKEEKRLAFFHQIIFK